MFPTDKSCENPSFSECHYKYKTKAGVEFQRICFCYSPKLDRWYYKNCWLFADSNKLNSYFWVDNVNDWKSLSTKIKQHKSSIPHLVACAVYEFWIEGKESLELEIRKETNL